MKYMQRIRLGFFVLFCFSTLVIVYPGIGSAPQVFTLTIAHLNDTHSHLESDRDVQIMKFGGIDTRVFLGGFPRLKSALDKMKRESENFMLLHAGDALQGTLYFSLFDGEADMELLNMLGVDAMTFGNHEFDKGPELTGKIINMARFPFVSTNIDFTGVPEMARKVMPYLIKDYGGQQVAIIGITTEYTPQISNPGPRIKFKKAAESLKQTVTELTARGINKIVVLSHMGYEEDKKLAASVSGVDVIVGGHSHTLLGDKAAFGALGLDPQGDYPTVIKGPDGTDVLIVQAWRWGGVIGFLRVHFDQEGRIMGYEGNPVLVMGPTFIQSRKEVPPDSETYGRILKIINDSSVARIYEEDPAVKRILQPYRERLEELMKTPVAEARDDIIRTVNGGPGPIIADSMVWKTGARLALLNRGGVRRDVYTGEISVGTVMEILPFGNSLILMELTGQEIKEALEEGVDFQLLRNPGNPLFPYVSGMIYAVNVSAARGARISDLKVRYPDHTYGDIIPGHKYKLVTNSFVAQGGDGYSSLKAFKGYKEDTGIIDADAFIEYLKFLKTITNPTERRIALKLSLLFGGSRKYADAGRVLGHIKKAA